MMKVLVLLMLVCSVYAVQAYDLHAALSELTLEVKNLQADNKELAAKPDTLEDLETEVEKLKKQLQEQAAKLEDQQTEVEKLNETLQEQAAKQQTELDKLENQQQGKQVAFSASLVTTGEQTIGPYSLLTPIVYKHVVTNIGNAYSPVTGAFTAPLKGAYHFEWHIFGPGGAPTGAVLVKNSERVFLAYEEERTQRPSASQGVTLLLEAGDVVSVQLYQTAKGYDSINHHTTFSGHLLFTM